MRGPSLSSTLRPNRPSVALGVTVAILAVAVVTLLVYPLRQVAPAVSLGVVYLLPVLAVAAYAGRTFGIATAVGSAFAFNFFHVEPVGRLTIANGQDWVALAIYVITAVVLGTLADVARVRASDAEERRREADLAAELARLLLGAPDVTAVLPVASQRLADAIGASSASLVLTEVADRAQHERAAFALDLGPGRRPGTLLLPGPLDDAAATRIRERLVPGLGAVLRAALEREGLEREVVETRALRRSDEIKTAVLRSVSHDLRSPLTSIIAAADALSSPALQPDERGELAESVGDEARRLSDLVDKLLDLSRLQAGAAEPRPDWLALDELIDAALRSIGAGRGEAEGDFRVQIDADIPLLRADGAQIERAIANLLENARRFAAGHEVSVRARAVGHRLVLRVVDRGPGVAAADRERIFEPFYQRGERGHMGSGLGLAVARGFVQANGGRVWCESLPGQGTSFVVELPLEPVPA